MFNFVYLGSNLWVQSIFYSTFQEDGSWRDVVNVPCIGENVEDLLLSPYQLMWSWTELFSITASEVLPPHYDGTEPSQEFGDNEHWKRYSEQCCGHRDGQTCGLFRFAEKAWYFVLLNMNIKNVCNETLINMRIDEYHDAVSNIQTIILSESYLSESGGGAQQHRHYALVWRQTEADRQDQQRLAALYNAQCQSFCFR